MIPKLIGYDDDLLTIEMTIVSPPFCLDSAGAYLDRHLRVPQLLIVVYAYGA